VFLVGCDNKNGQDLVLEKKPIQVKVLQVEKGTFTKSLTYKGTVNPWKRANIGPEVSGRIGKIYKKQGDVVQKGDLLAELDCTTMKLQKKQAEAALAVAMASFKDAVLNFQRIKSLYEKKAVSKMQYEKSQLALEAADTQKKSAEASFNVIRHTLSNSYMKAPFAGIITSKNYEEGDTVNPMMGMSAGVLTLMDMSRVKIVLDVPAEDVEKIEIGQPCAISVSTIPLETFMGEVFSKNLAADPLSKTFKVEVVVDNPETKIKAGIFAEVGIEILRNEDVFVLPNSALMDENQLVLFNGGKAKYIKIKIADSSEYEFVVSEGLVGGETVVVDGNYDLKEDSLIALEGNEK
jgi:RND family efflux transporter MFP subunit